MDNKYNKFFYDSFCGEDYSNTEHWTSFFGSVADKIVEIFSPKTALDAGCASGYLVSALRERGVEAWGFDISSYAIASAPDEIRPYLNVQSMTDPLPENFPKRYDVAITIEVLEHMFPEEGSEALKLLCSYSDNVIFSSTPSDIENRTHVNVQQAEYWAKEFSKNSFYRNLMQPMDFISPQAVLFQKQSYVPNVIFDYENLIRIDKNKNYAKSLYEASVFFDGGDGFSENKKISFTYESSVISSERIPVPNGTLKIRFDALENYYCAISNLKAFTNFGEIKYEVTNATLVRGNTCIFTHCDPWVIFNVENQSVMWIQFYADILVMKNANELIFANEYIENYKDSIRLAEELNNQSSVYDKKINELSAKIFETNRRLADTECELRTANTELFEKSGRVEDLEGELTEKDAENKLTHDELDKTSSELETYKEHYCMAIDQRNALSARVAELERMYNCIAGSASWKITKPLRFTLDVLKKIFRKIPPFRLMYKFLKCLKQNGLRYTIRKIKGKFRHNKIATQNIITEEQIKEQQSIVFERDIKFSILVPLYNTPDNLLREMIESVTAQTYSNWELCLADGSDDKHSYVEETAMIYSSIDPRVKYMRLEQNLGISENTNNCEKMATGDFICLLDHDDLIAPNALFENAKAINETGADVLYSDEDHLSMNGLHVNPFYKPDYSPDLLRSQMYICHFLVINRSLFESIGGFRKEFDGSQDYDLMLRLSEQTERICHIPKILYTWRECEGSTAANADAKPYAHTAGLNALDSHLKRVYGDGAYASESEYTFVFDARYSTMKDNPKVSIIIPMKDKHELTDACIKSILEKSTYQNYEIIILDNRSSNKKTFAWFKEIVKTDERISVHVADMEFNWSKINNYGISLATGDVYIFLNNDIEVITLDWIERLCENALRDDIGVVGPLLLYEDDTIQHAGVVVGLGGWADHVFKGMKPIHYGAPYVSPMVSRNVLAVTGACLAVSKKTIEKIGSFDESFIICGSDIELGIRAYENGLNNKYVSTVRLYHYESKSRDSYIPEQDFKRSYEAYTPYRENVDPYYNINLDINSVLPLESVADMSKCNFKNFLKRCPLTAPICKAIKRAIMPPAEYEIPEILGITPRVDSKDDGKIRINLLTPSVDIKHVFGGISTAMKYFESLRRELGCNARMITTDAPVEKATSVAPNEYEIISCDDDSSVNLQLVSFSSRYNKSIPVRENDIFVATGWWTAYTIKDVIEWQAAEFGKTALPLVYMIQDYEPGFYPWSSRYMMADSTYRLKTPIYAVINSHLLREFLDNNGYRFDRAWDFEPVLNDSLRAFLPTDGKTVDKKKQILVYGRPTTDRNAFALLMAGIKKWREKFEGAEEWTVLSAGEAHDDIDLGGGVYIRSCGKLTLEEYANTMLDTYAGVSLMVSPHPSYPPLEMSTFGVKTITNTYSNKDLSNFNDNIISLKSCSADDIGEALTKICETYTGVGTPVTNTDYARGGEPFGNCVVEMSTQIKAIFN